MSKAFLVLSLLFSAAVQAQQGNNVTINITGVGSVALAGAAATFTLNGAAQITGLGSAPIFATGTVSSLSGANAGVVTGTYAIFYANGDLLTGQVSVPAGFVIQSIAVPAGATGTITVTGGTGSFAGATGTFSNVTGSGTATGTFTSNIQASGSGSFKAPAFRAAGTLSFAGSMAHIAAGGGWKTIVTVLNNGTTAAQARVSFFDEAGNPLSLPLTFPQGGTPATTASSVTQTIRPGGELVIESQGTESTLSQGSAQLFTDGNVTAFVIFRYNPSGQEAAVPLQVQNATSYTLSFDNTGGLATGVALANISDQAASIPVTLRDDTGATVTNEAVQLPARGHVSFVATGRFAPSADKRGTIEFQTPAGGQISALALRFNAAGAFTTIPPAAK
jgi:hypothetical protein